MVRYWITADFYDILTETICVQKTFSDAPLHRCTLKDDHIKLHSHHSPCSVFESGVVKIQHNEVDSMKDDERAACEHLNIQKNHVETSVVGEEQRGLSMTEMFKSCKRRREDPAQSYMNLGFILEPYAEIGLIFSLGGGILADNRKHLALLLCESLLFLKVNSKYWYFQTVCAPMLNKIREVTARIEEDDKQQTLHDS